METGVLGSSVGGLEDLGDEIIDEISINWEGFCSCSEVLINGGGGKDPAVVSEFSSAVKVLCKHGLASFIEDFFLRAIEQSFRKNGASRFWSFFHDDDHNPAALEVDKGKDDTIEDILITSLEEICSLKRCQEKCLSLLESTLLSFEHASCAGNGSFEKYQPHLLSKYQLMVSSVMLSTLPGNFPEFLRTYFKRKLEELNTVMMDDDGDGPKDGRYHNDIDNRNKLSEIDEMDVDESHRGTANSSNNILVRNVGRIVNDLRSLGFAAMTEDAYASAIFLLLKVKVEDLVDDDYRTPVLELIKEWIQVVILPFLTALLSYLGDILDEDLSSQESPLAFSPFIGKNVTSEGLIRWKLRLEYFAYETVQDLRTAKLFDIIVDYPDSSPAIEDLKQCLENTGQHSELIDSFIYALRYRLLTAGASTNDILHQYLSTIKALRRIDPTGVFLESVGEPIRDYLRGRKDTIKCIVTMLTDGTGGNSGGSGNAGDSLLEELIRNADNLEIPVHDDFNADDKQAWINAQSWEPDPIEADPLKGSRSGRKVDILGMIVSIIGSKDQLVNQYRIMLAEKLLNKSDYDINSETLTLELLKIHFGESSMQRCEIMLNDLIHSKRINANIKATLTQSSQRGTDELALSMDLFDATIISSNFWPPFQLELESVHLPEQIDQLLTSYAQRFHEIKAPRKLNWKKNLGVVKLELEFEDRSVEFRVSPLCAIIIMKFQEQSSWTSRNLSASIGVPVDALKRAISFWISKGIISESIELDSDDHIFTIIEDMGDTNKNNINSGKFGGLLAAEEEGESSISSIGDQFKKEMTVYEKFIFGMLTNFGSMALERIHNTLKMFCIADHPYDKSVHQLQNFLSGLVSEEKLELRDGMYFLKK